MPIVQSQQKQTWQHKSNVSQQQHVSTQHRPLIALITTGGTIAGSGESPTDTTAYTAACLSGSALLAKIPELNELAQIQIIPLFDIDSKDITAAHWHALAEHTQALIDAPEIRGIVITHGTDTLEETAFVLDLTLRGDKPVVMTGAMRPASALSADGPMNLYDAVCAAIHPDSAGRGIIVCFNRTLFSGRSLRKQHTRALDAFCGGNQGHIGQTGPVRYFSPPSPRFTLTRLISIDKLPRVDVLHVGGDTSPSLLAAVVAAGARGVVLALPGNGSLPSAWEDSVRNIVADGTPIVRASRCANGEVTYLPVDERTGSRPAGDLSPAVARLWLAMQLAEATENAADGAQGQTW